MVEDISKSDTLVESEVATCESPQRRRILIIDDDPSQTEVLAYSFQQQGFLPIVVHSGTEGLALARSERPDVILLDIEMPGTNGLEICRELNDDPKTCGIPIVMLSGTDRSDVIRQCRMAGCQFFVGKPYDPNALLTLANVAIEESKAW